jgi:DnaJ-class molecular chaperone
MSNYMSNFHERKAERTKKYNENHGRKLIKCGACNGSGIYDNIGTPPCGFCGGLGKVRESLSTFLKPIHWRDKLKRENEIKAIKREKKTS